MKEEGTGFICEALKVNKTIKELKMRGSVPRMRGFGLSTSHSSNIGGPEGAKHVADMLMVNTSLTTLDISGNGYGPDGEKALAKGLAGNTSLTSLNGRSRITSF